MDKQLNEKLARWAGFKQSGLFPKCDYHWEHQKKCANWFTPEGFTTHGPFDRMLGRLPNFSDSLDLCFKWLVPKTSVVGVDFQYFSGGVRCFITYMSEPGFDTEHSLVEVEHEGEAYGMSALALCKAIEQYIGQQ